MKPQSRLKRSLRNASTMMAGQILTILLNFASRTVLIKVLGINYIGINGLFSNILSVLSLAELGIGSAIIYSLYKPLADSDQNKVSALMYLYANAYRIIGAIVFGAGLIIMPFLNLIIKDKPSDIEHLYLIYFMFLLNSVLSYFFSYKKSLLIADQKQFVIVLYEKSILLVQILVQIIVLYATKNFLIYLLVMIVSGVLGNVLISKRVDRMYPYLEDGARQKLAPKDKKKLFDNIRAMFMHNIGEVVVFGTDNILISAFIGVYWVGLYANYVLITGMIKTMVGLIFNAITPSIGNLIHTDSQETRYEVFEVLFLIGFWLYGFSGICLYVLLNPFIRIWIGNEYLLSNGITLVIVVSFYISGMRQAVLVFKNTLGLFWNDRYKPIAESILNLGASMLLLHYYGFIGVLFGTLISTLMTSFWIEPLVVYRNGFNKRLSVYFKKYAAHTMLLGFTGFGIVKACAYIEGNSLLEVFLRLVICVLGVNGIFILVFHKSRCFKRILSMRKAVF